MNKCPSPDKKVLGTHVIAKPGYEFVECGYCHRPQFIPRDDKILGHFCNEWCWEEYKKRGGPFPTHGCGFDVIE